MAAAKADGKDALARGLGAFSVGLGLAQLAAPRAVSRLIGIAPSGTRATVMRAMGAREIGTGVGIFAKRRPAEFLWARVAGDMLDLAVLGYSMTLRGTSKTRLGGAIAAVVGVTGPDVVEATRLSRVSSDGGGIEATAVLTVNKSPEEVYWFWHEFENFPRFMTHLESVQVTGEGRSHWQAKGPAGKKIEWDAETTEERPDELISWRSLPGADVDNSGSVRFTPAPGGRGTEVRVEVRYAPPAGPVGAALAKLLGTEPKQQVRDDLKRFKAVIEAGEVARSDALPAGENVAELPKQRPARPVGSGKVDA
jgi:uncharacterized membrane protein